LDDKGKCNKLNCMFKHYPDVPLQQAQAPELAAAATQHNQHNSEMDELKAMISTLIKDGANQKALIAQLLEQDD